MSADAHIPSSRLRAPANLSSFVRSVQQRNHGGGSSSSSRTQNIYSSSNSLYDFTDSAFRGLMDPTNPIPNATIPGNDPSQQPLPHSQTNARIWADARMQREAYHSNLVSDNFRDGQNGRNSNPINHNQHHHHHLDPMNTSMYGETYQDGGGGPMMSSMGISGVGGNWLDLDRFEDWQRPTLDVLCPDIHIPGEDELFPIAIAEDGETLPSELHPSHPYGDLHQPQLAYSSRFHVLRKFGGGEPGLNSKLNAQSNHKNAESSLEIDRDLRRLMNDGNDGDDDHLDIDQAMAAASAAKEAEGIEGSDEQNRSDQQQSNHHSIALNPPRWPFKRFGPGSGGPNSLLRNELRKPWKPYRVVWSELDLKSLG